VLLAAGSELALSAGEIIFLFTSPTMAKLQTEV